MSIGFLMVLIINFINHPFWGATQMFRIFAGYCKQVQDETCTSQYLQPGSYGSPEITWRLDMGISPSGTVLDM
jgi:hypothetical protein